MTAAAKITSNDPQPFFMVTADAADVRFQEDVLILAGDIANTMEVLEETLLLLKARFQRIFFCPGSLADWWNTCPVMVWPWGGRRLLKLKPQTDEVGDFGLQLHRGGFEGTSIGKALVIVLQGVGETKTHTHTENLGRILRKMQRRKM